MKAADARGLLFAASLVAIPIGVGLQFGLGWAVIVAGFVGLVFAVAWAVDAIEQRKKAE